MGTPIPENRARFTLDELCAATGGALWAAPEGPAFVEGITTDTRRCAPGAAFVALVGATHDGHRYLPAAASAGARVALVERDVPRVPGLGVVRVESTLRALGDLARAHRRRWGPRGSGRRLVAITGSAGKTTTRGAVASLLAELFPGEVHAGHGNLNNQVGAPAVLLGLAPHHRVAVVELGTNAPGEIAVLASIAEPDVAVLTLIALAHAEGLGSLEAIAREKGALFDALHEEGTAVGNADDPRVREALARCRAARRVGYGRATDATIRVVARAPVGVTRSRVTLTGPEGGRLEVVVPLLGEAGALAVAAAVAVAAELTGRLPEGSVLEHALLCGVDHDAGGRLAPLRLRGDVVLLDDTYNANPASVLASVEAAAELARAAGRRLLLVLGEMRELGPLAVTQHEEAGRKAAASGAAVLLAVGGDAAHLAAAARAAGGRAQFYPGVAEAEEAVRVEVQDGDLVLLKGSRGVALERLVRALVQDRGLVEPQEAADLPDRGARSAEDAR